MIPITEDENIFRNIEFVTCLGPFAVYDGVRPRVLVATCDTLEAAIEARDRDVAFHAQKRTARETATYPKIFEARAHA